MGLANILFKTPVVPAGIMVFWNFTHLFKGMTLLKVLQCLNVDKSSGSLCYKAGCQLLFKTISMFVLYSYNSPLRMIISWLNLYRIAATMSHQAPRSLYTYNAECVFEIHENFQATDLFRIALCLSRTLKYYMIVFLQMLVEIHLSV